MDEISSNSKLRAPAAREHPKAEPEVLRERAVTPPPKPTKRSRIRWILFALLPLVLIFGGYWYATGGQVVSIDDAYINAQTVGISTDVSGTIKDVDVKENEHVAAGAVLFRLDPRQFQIALESAKANLASVALNLDSMKVDYQRMLSDIAAQQAQENLDQANYNRDAKLVTSGAIPKATFDQIRFTLASDQSKVRSLQEQARVQLAKLGGVADGPVENMPAYRQAKAQVDEAQRELDHTTVKAPFEGVVTNVSTVAPGKYLPASTTAFYLVDTDHTWVDADPKETELTYVKPGQKVTVTVDSYPDAEWTGTVQGISPAAAQEFAVLPAQNTSGNWVKVVQRVPLRVQIDTKQKSLPPLRAGMSAVADVDTGHARGLPHFLTSFL